ncbi:putative nuclease of the RecB family [Pseudomonas amygdali pv. mori]|uniref:Putative nuclease of the RecB family n=1 Tax=Pseudomonas amygdali pv. mori TaxID=34065 RepID=A0A3M5INJ2_PSEA0|nr:endonuclease NucS domain-containing protein [Pseudomonas amygdali]RMT12421.1 putative nuclease of the RecB family [Pseudomonas amygdali pv. mori]
MQPPKGYFVVDLTPTGTRNLYPMKEWCRQFPEDAPPLNPNTTNSQALRRGFAKMGWVTETTETQVLIFRPGTPKHTVLAIENEDLALDEQDTPDTDRETVFELEWQLRDFIAHNIETLRVDGKALRLYVDDIGRDGVEYPTGVGPIDILALDSDDSFVVFELKRGRVADKAIGQISRYMGWIKKNLAKGKMVKGVIVAKSISSNLRHAIVAVPNVSLFEYEVAFSLNQIQEADESL